MTSAGHRDPDQLRTEIERTRADLGRTVAALAAKADVKARVKDTAKHASERVKAQTEDALHRARRPIPVAAVAVAAAIVIAVFVMNRRRRGQ
jgi:anti-sigma-K factor RskA